jgi:excisionase family DNA binding protein
MKRVLANLKTEEIMTVSALARYLRCNRSLIYRLLRERQIPAFKLGKNWRFLRSDIDEFVARGGGHR